MAIEERFLRTVGSQFRSCLDTDKDKKKEPGNCRAVNLTLTPGKVIQPVILETISGRRKDKKVLGSSQRGFTG